MNAKNERDTGNAAAPFAPTDRPGAQPVAVIDIGSSSIRMSLAEIRDGNVRVLDTLQQSVALGKDVFTCGSIHKDRIEECVRVLRSFRKFLDEHGLRDRGAIRAVATTAVREAANRDVFLDRIYMATGFDVNVLSEADTTRLTYLSMLPHVRRENHLARSTVIIVEMGGGTTEVLAVRGENVILSNTYRLGALRLRQTAEQLRAPAAQTRELMENAMDRAIDHIRFSVPKRGGVHVVALGGDARYAVQALTGEQAPEGMIGLPVRSVASLASKLLETPVETIAERYKMPLSDADTIGPALLFYARLARSYSLRHLLVSPVTMRHGLLDEMASVSEWTEAFQRQILRAARDIGRKYRHDEAHAEHVAELSAALFTDLASEHRLGKRHELLLKVGALLHDIGTFISTASHHKHSMYLIQNSELFGLSAEDLTLVAHLARYHRRAPPRPTHVEFMALTREQRLEVCLLAGILRVADALDVSHTQRIKNISCHREEGHLVIEIPGAGDLSLEDMALRQKGPMFQDIYGMDVLLRPRE